MATAPEAEVETGTDRVHPGATAEAPLDPEDPALLGRTAPGERVIGRAREIRDVDRTQIGALRAANVGRRPHRCPNLM